MATLKFQLDGEFRRARIANLTWDDVREALGKCFPDVNQARLDVKYRDDEDDLCLLTPATFPDFASLNQHTVSVIRLWVHLNQASNESVPANAGVDKPALTPDAMSDGNCLMASQPPQPSFFHQVLQSLHQIAALAGREALVALFIHFTPRLLCELQGEGGRAEELAAEKPEVVRSLLTTLRQYIDPFPQLQEMHMVLDQLLQRERLEGVGAVASLFLRCLTQLPFEQQRDIASVVLSDGIFEKLLQLFPEEAPRPPEAWVHQGITCDGCGASPLCGPRFKCTDCPDYDLCCACYLHRDILHPSHAFRCILHGVHKGKGKGLLRGSKGWGKGWGREAGKGWGKGRGSSSSSSSTSSESSSSDGRHKSAHKWSALKQELRAAKRMWKVAQEEAKANWKAAKKAWKKQKHQQKKAMKECKKLEKKALRRGSQGEEQPASSGLRLTFPVEVGDGRRLSISWMRGDAPDEVAARFALQHGLAVDELPTILQFIHTAEASTCASSSSSTVTPALPPAPDGTVEMDGLE